MVYIGLMLFIEIISHFGVLMYMGVMQRRGKLTEQFFALVQVGYSNLYVLTGFLITPLTLKITMAFITITILLWVLGYPFTRWIYRQMFLSK